MAVAILLFGFSAASAQEQQVSERVIYADGTFSLVLADRDIGIMEMDDGVLSWQYIGQARFPVEPHIETEVWSVEPEYVLTSLNYDPEAYLGVGQTTKVDELGRLWLLDGVDLDAAYTKILDHRAATNAQFRQPETAPGTRLVDAGIEYSESPGEWSLTYPQSWTTQECDSGDPGPEIYEHDPDQITLISGAYTEWQRKVVVVWINTSQFMCSGILVDNNTVLTAAHCIADSSGYLFPANSFEACTYGNVQSAAVCINGSDLDTPGGSWDGSKTDDYGLINLDSSFNVGWFGLADADDSVIDNFTDFVRSYPTWEDGCNLNLESDAVTIDDAFPGSHLHAVNGSIQSTPTGYIKFNTGSADGMSGGPHFYCPNGSGCVDGHYVTAVQGGMSYSGFLDTGYSHGPKARTINDWVVANQ